MRTLIVTAFVSLDGVMEAPGGEPGYRNAGWTFKDIEFVPTPTRSRAGSRRRPAACCSAAELRGLRTGVADHGRLRRLQRDAPLRRVHHAGARPTGALAGHDPAVARRRRGAQGDRRRSDPVHGSATLGASLADAGLVDRYHLLVFPLLLGAGKRLFSEADKDATKLKLVEHEVYGNGIQKQVFDVLN